jgi:ketosteroid isomerase-like protein
MPAATPDQLIRRFCEGFAARKSADLEALFDLHGLFEFPLLQPRLVGTAEIRAGLDCAFAVADRIEMRLRDVKATARFAVAEGTMQAYVARDGRSMSVPFAVVAEARDGKLGRLSIYCDAHPYRLWTDGPVMAIDTAAQ